MTAIRIAKEFSVRLVIEHGTDGYKIAAELAAARVPVVHGPWIKVRGNVEQSGRSPESPRILIENGVLTAFSTDHPVIAIQNMRLQADQRCGRRRFGRRGAEGDDDQLSPHHGDR